MVVNPERSIDPRQEQQRRLRNYAEVLMAAYLAQWFTGQRARVIARLIALDRISIGSVRDLLPATENVSLQVAYENILTRAATMTAEAQISQIQPLVRSLAQPVAMAPIVSITGPVPRVLIPPRPVERFVSVPPSATARNQPVTRYLVRGERPNVAELVRHRVQQSARRVVQINAVTRRAIREQLSVGLERGYSRLQIAAGVPEDGYAGIGSVVEETYHNRPFVIARTEVSTITNRAVAEAAGLMGYARVRVHDGHIPGDECGWLSHDDPNKADGQLVHVRSAYQTPTSHPNCVRWFEPEETADVLGSRANGTRVQ